MPALYRFKGVPKTFTTKAAALRFLANSPGYVERRSDYLRAYWPGLMQELEKKKAPAARTRGQLASAALANMKTSGPGLGDVASAVGKTLLNERVGQRAARATPGLIKATPGAVKANVNWMADLARSDHGTQEATLDFTIGKGLTNLAQGQGPKNWQDVAGLGVGVAGILPIGKGVKGAAALRAAFKGEKAAETTAGAAKVAKAVGDIFPEGTLFHGSPEGELGNIDVLHHTKPWREGPGFFLTTDPEKAGKYAAGKTANAERKAAGKGALNAFRIKPDANVLDLDAQTEEFWKNLTSKIIGEPVDQRTWELWAGDIKGSGMSAGIANRQRAMHLLTGWAELPKTDAYYEIEEALHEMGVQATKHTENGVPVWVVKDASVLERVAPTARASESAAPPGRPPSPPPTELGAAGTPPGGGGPLGPKTLNETVQDALKGAPEAIAAQNKAYSQERAIRIKSGLKAYYDAGGGTEGANALFGELKGELPKVSWGGFTEFTPETADKMIRHIVEGSDLREYEVPRAIAGMRRMIAGRPPQENQRVLLERVFGKDNIDSITNPANAGVLQFIHKHALEVWNTPRTLMASFDLSAPFRQGLVAGARHPVIFAKNFKPMVKAWGSEEFSKQIMDEIYSSPNLTRYYKAKLALTDAAGPTALREEQFPPGLLDKAPGVKHSARAYSSFLDLQRTKVFDRMIDVAETDSRVSKLLGPTLSHYLGFSVKNVDDPEFLDALGRYINVATGRGKLPWKTAEKAAPFLNSFLFSPRLMASRIAILNPFYYVNLYRQSPFVARQAAQAFVATLGGVSAMLYLASNIPGVKVGANPLSADFGKIRVGNTRIDIAGGLQQYLVLYTRLIRGKSVSSSTGKTQDLKGGYGDSSRLDVLTRFIEGKFAPSAGMIRDALNGQTFIGDPLTPQGMAYSNLTPLNVQGGIELYNTEGSIPAAVGGGLLSSIGFGVNSYPDKPPSTRKKGSGKWLPGSSSGSSSGSSGVWLP